MYFYFLKLWCFIFTTELHEVISRNIKLRNSKFYKTMNSKPCILLLLRKYIGNLLLLYYLSLLKFISFEENDHV
jgi:hypothetical protein